MAYLHKNKEEFLNAVDLAAERFHIKPDEKLKEIIKAIAEELANYELDFFEMKVQEVSISMTMKMSPPGFWKNGSAMRQPYKQ